MSILKPILIGATGLCAALIAIISYGSIQTERDITAFQTQVTEVAALTPAPLFDATSLSNLPSPVQRYLAYTFRAEPPVTSTVTLEAAGKFRRPLTDSFAATTAEQVIATGTPALMFSATTPVFGPIWARAYDYYADGEMEMKAKVMSTLTVVDEQGSETLNRISLRRWLLESPLYPQALLPGGPVTWEAVDTNTARATVSAADATASMLFHFNAKGQITHLSAEEDGDLTTTYHGSGEHVTRSDYREVSNMMIPHTFTISRMAGGQVYPFFEATLTKIRFD